MAPQPAPEPRLTLTQKSVPLSEALRHVAELSGLRLRFEENAAVLARE